MSGIPPEVESWIGQPRYEEESEFPVERGYIWTSCASVENGNPIFWDDEVAAALTDGPIAPPTMLQVWVRPHHWMPGRKQAPLALQLHFDVKEKLGLPEGIATDNEIRFGKVCKSNFFLALHMANITSPLKVWFTLRILPHFLSETKHK